MTKGKKDILIITGRYLPGYKDGGPVRSIKNLTDFLGDEYNFRILTCDRDHGDTEPYPNICVDDWNEVGKANVYYVEPGGFSRKIITELANQVDLVYVCGCFSDYSINTLIAKRLGKVKKPIVIAPMGLFMPNAMKKKPIKYKGFLTVCKLLGFFNNVVWSVTSEYEEECTKAAIFKKAKCYIAEDLPRVVDTSPIQKDKVKGELKVFFISRISPEKNLFQNIEVLKICKSKIKFTIYGPIYNEDYWKKIQNKIEELPSNIQVEYKGNANSEKIIEILKSEHVFLFMTIGENFGHVIQESLAAGCPCVISNQTPWQDLEKKKAGYVFSLDNNEIFAEKLDMFAMMSEDEFQKRVNMAHEYAIKVSNDKVKNSGYRNIFDMID